MNKRLITLLLTVALVIAGLTWVAAQAKRPAKAPAAPQATAAPSKVDALVAQMTLEEKISMLYGTTDPQPYGEAGYLPGVPRLGIPPLRLSDGPAGIRTAQPATAMPAPVALASTFSTDLAKQYGQVVGRDALARHQNVVLAPMVNIVRVPQGGRNFETFGEDPLLASRLVGAEVEGMQSQGVIATVKHFAFNNQENDRVSVSADVDEQTGQEIELAAFEGAIRAGVGSVMCSYNRVNGTYAAENPQLLTDVLRGQLGFKGFVMSDWGAVHSGAPSLKAGMEMEMPSGRYYGSLADAVKKGELSEAVVNEAVKRILTAMDAAGLLTPSASARPVPEIPRSTPAARDIAIAGAVLLKNDGNVLPLGADSLQSLAVIGATAKLILIGGGGSAHVQPMKSESPLDVLQRKAGASARITYAKGYEVDGDPVPAAVLKPNAAIVFTGAAALPPGMSLTWTGTIVPPKTGDYVMKVQTTGGRGSLSFVRPAQGGRGRGGAPAAPAAVTGGVAAAPAGGGFPTGGAPPPDIPGFGAASLLPTTDGMSNASYPVHMEAGVEMPLTVTATPGRGGATPLQVRLAWVSPDIQKARIDEAVAAARNAKIAVVFAYDEGTEGRDRASLSLPGYQDALIEAVAAANPRTVVVLSNGAPVLMPWAGKVAAILQTWYPGQEGADATAAMLLGEASPGGRLPVTFPRRAEDAPTAPPERYPGVNVTTHDGQVMRRGAYSEGIYVGYRWYDKQNVEPLFPFGHGLSYTTFAYSGLSVRAAKDGYDVAFTVKNTGTKEGVDVPQIYLGPPEKAPAPMAVKKLVGFERVSLGPGQSKQVKIRVDARGLSYWSSADHRWTVAPGKRTFMLGASSRNIKLQKDVTVPAPRRTT